MEEFADISEPTKAVIIEPKAAYQDLETSVPKSKILSMSESCPSCDSETGLREILYGVPTESMDESKYVIGGCLVSGHDPIWACVECGWRGWGINNDLGSKLYEWQCHRRR